MTEVARYGCHNQPRAAGYWVIANMVSITESGIVLAAQRLKWHDDTSSRECRYDGRAGDRKCEGCVK